MIAPVPKRPAPGRPPGRSPPPALGRQRQLAVPGPRRGSSAPRRSASARAARSAAAPRVSSSSASRRIAWVRVVGSAQRARPRRAREVGEPQPQHDRAAAPPRFAQPPGDPVDEPGQRHRAAPPCAAVPAAERALGPDRAPALAHPHRPRIVTVGQRVQMAARGPPDDRLAASPSSPCRQLAHRAGSRRAWSLPAVTFPTPHTALDRQRVQERRARARARPRAARPACAAALAILARNFVRATPTVIGSPTCSRTSRRSRWAISHRGAGDVLEPADVEERLVDRQRLDHRRVASRTPRTPHGSPRRRPRSAAGTTAAYGHSRRACAAAHRRPHAAPLRLVARGQHDAAADDHRPAVQPRVVALLDGGVERVEVGVEDRSSRASRRTYVRIAAAES